MKISSTTQFEPNLYANTTQQNSKPVLVTGTIASLSHITDKVEISAEGRQLAAADIVNHSAKYFGTVQINESLNRLLTGKPTEVTEAVYGIIQSNFINDSYMDDRDERAANIELGLAQAGYIADNYMTEDEAAEFRQTMEQIAAIAKTGVKDGATGQIRYITPADKPIGAPEDYVKTSDLMRRYEPDTYSRLQDAIVNGKNWGSILLDFAKKVPSHSDWRKNYIEEDNNLKKNMQQSVSSNRFQTASTSGLEEFVQSIKTLIAGSGVKNIGAFMNNTESFIQRLKTVNS